MRFHVLCQYTFCRLQVPYSKMVRNPRKLKRNRVAKICLGRAIMVHNVLFYTHTQWVYFKPILCFTHSQDGKKGNKNITKTFARLHNHCPWQGIQFRTANAGASSGCKRFDTGPSLLAMVMLALLWLFFLAIFLSKLAMTLFSSLLLHGRGLRHRIFRFCGGSVSELDSSGSLPEASDIDSSEDIKSTVRHGINFLLSSSEIVVDWGSALRRFTCFYKEKKMSVVSNKLKYSMM